MDLDPNLALVRVKWSTQKKGVITSPPQVYHEFWVAVDFFQRKGLTTHTLAACEGDINDDFAILRKDLTDEGMALFRSGYQRWLNALDSGKTPEAALPIMERALKKAAK